MSGLWQTSSCQHLPLLAWCVEVESFARVDRHEYKGRTQIDEHIHESYVAASRRHLKCALICA